MLGNQRILDRLAGRYRSQGQPRIHLGRKILQRVDGTNPVTHSFGGSIYIQPFVKWAYIPEKWTLIKQLYAGPVGAYDLHYWYAGLQVHAGFSLK